MATDTLPARERAASTPAPKSSTLLPSAQGDGERLTRAREAWIAAYRPAAWRARRIRAGKSDNRLRAILIALEDADRPLSLITADRDEATVALIMRSTPGLAGNREAAGALLDAVRMGRRG